MARKRRRLPTEPVSLEITDLSHDGRGVGHHNDKAVFVRGALPGETVAARLTGRHRRFDEALCEEIANPSPDRVEPPCPWFEHCGGCALQHLEAGAQLKWKHKRLVDNLERIGGVGPEQWWAPISSSPWHYRRRSRLSVRLVRAKGRVLVGFREPRGRYVADIEDCRVLHPVFGERLMDLSNLIGQLSIADSIPQIETANGDDSAAMIVRHMEPFSTDDLMLLKRWSDDNDIAIYLQPKGPDTVHLLWPQNHQLSYRLDEFDLTVNFSPQHFIQVNAKINRALVSRAVELMALEADDRVLDLFCGLGNFTLPLATRAGRVTGVEGEPALIEAAKKNAKHNGIDNADWAVADLTTDVSTQGWYRAGFDAVLIDPPRSGALEVLPVIANSGARRVVYVSCNPATLARDAGELVDHHGFRLAGAGIADMFPHTAHTESIALFERS